jgi:hypothetical protein
MHQRQHDRARRISGMEQAIGKRGAHFDGRIIEEADQRSIERRVFVGRTVMIQIG